MVNEFTFSRIVLLHACSLVDAVRGGPGFQEESSPFIQQIYRQLGKGNTEHDRTGVGTGWNAD